MKMKMMNICNNRIVVRWIVFSSFIFHLSICSASIGMQALGDSLMTWTGFSPDWCPRVRVKNLRVNGNNITVYTNGTLKDVSWNQNNIAQLKRKVSRWVLGHGNGNVSIYTTNIDIETLVTECAKAVYGPKSSAGNRSGDLTERNIVLYPSHGLYFNRERDEWIWQRAALWTTVEDLYTHEYVRLVSRMLENAGATVIMPRAGLDRHELGVSGMPQWTEGARYWLLDQKNDSAIWNLYDGDEYKDDMKCRGMWVNALDIPVDLCIALHTDGQDSGNDSTIIGTLVIYTAKDDSGHVVLRDGRDREKTNRNLADWIQTQMTNDIRRTIAPEWTRRQLREANYCESRVPVVPSIILEVLSHKNFADMKYGLDPKFRFMASRAIYKGILRYLNGINAVVQPLPVQDLGVRITDGNAQTAKAILRWKPTLDSLESSAKPTYYMIYIQENDGEWDVQQVENTTEIELGLKRGIQYNFYVIAGNEGGLGFPSPMISAYLNDAEINDQMVLVVDAFNDTYGPQWFADSTYAGIVPDSYACEDGLYCAYIGAQWDYTRTHKWINDDNCGWGACYRDHAGQFTVGNTRDWSVLHGHVLRKMRKSYMSCTVGMLDDFDLQPATFYLVDYVCGRQRHPISSDNRQRISGYLDAGGQLLMSTDHFSAIDKVWAGKYLHAKYHAANATRSGRINSPRHRLYQLILEPNEEQLFTCTPEVLMPPVSATKEGKTVVYANYEDMRCPAAIGWKDSKTVNNETVSTSTLVYGFPLEAVQDFEKIYRHAIEWFKQ